MRTVRAAVLLVLAVGITCPVLGAEKKVEKKPPPDPAAQAIERMTAGLTLTADQQAKLADVAKALGPKLTEAMKKGDVLTPEQKKAQAEAMKAAKEAGKKGKEAADAVAAAVKMTDEQKAKEAEARKERTALERELREKVMSLLTAEQKEQLKKKAEEAKKKPTK